MEDLFGLGFGGPGKIIIGHKSILELALDFVVSLFICGSEVFRRNKTRP